jgi:YVTN family beta-propeller protein
MQLAWAEVVSPDSRTLYVANYSEKTVSVIDTATNAVTSTIFVRDWAQDLAITPDGSTLYTECNGALEFVAVINTHSQALTDIIPDVQQPTVIGVSPDGKSLWELGLGYITIVDTATNQFSSSINIGPETATDIAFAPDGAHAFVVSDTTAYEGRLFEVDTASLPTSYLEWLQDGVTGKLKDASSPTMSPDGQTLYFTIEVKRSGQLTKGVAVYDITRRQIKEKIVLDNYGAAGDSAITPDGKYLYVTYSGGVVLMFDTSTNQVVGPPITVGQDPRSVVIAPDGRRAYVLTGSLLGSDSVVVIDISP